MDEKELVEKILRGDEAAKGRFFEAYKDQLYRVSCNFLGYRDPDAEDVVQETFLTAFQKLGDFEFRSSLSTWLTRICIYKTYQRIEKRHRDLVRAHEDLEILTRPAAIKALGDQEEGDHRRERMDLIARCLDRLKKQCQEILKLRDMEGESYSVIGKKLKLPIGTVMSRLSRCKEALKALVKGELEGNKNGGARG